MFNSWCAFVASYSIKDWRLKITTVWLYMARAVDDKRWLHTQLIQHIHTDWQQLELLTVYSQRETVPCLAWSASHLYRHINSRCAELRNTFPLQNTPTMWLSQQHTTTAASLTWCITQQMMKIMKRPLINCVKMCNYHSIPFRRLNTDLDCSGPLHHLNINPDCSWWTTPETKFWSRLVQLPALRTAVRCK